VAREHHQRRPSAAAEEARGRARRGRRLAVEVRWHSTGTGKAQRSWLGGSHGALRATVMATGAVFARGGAKRSQGRGRGGERRSGDARASTTEGAGGAGHAAVKVGRTSVAGACGSSAWRPRPGHAAAIMAFYRTRGVQRSSEGGT
jgi:hypothetical protein